MIARNGHYPLARLIVFVGTLGLLVAGCSNSVPQSGKVKPQTLKWVATSVGTGQPIANLDPGDWQDVISEQMNNLLYDSLVAIDASEHAEPWAASAWKVSDDGRTYTFLLRPNQMFSDGKPVAASDFAWSLERTMNPCRNVPLGGTFFTLIKDAATYMAQRCAEGHVQGVIKTLIGDSLVADDSANTLTITLTQPAGYFLAALASPMAAVLERSAVTGVNLGADGAWTKQLTQGSTGQGGSGIFYLAQEIVATDSAPGRLTLRPNPHWWGRQAGKLPNFSEVDVLATDDHTTTSGAFRSDSSIAMASISQDDPDMPTLKQQSYYYEIPALGTISLAFNWKKTPFDDLNARKAFCLAINRDAASQQVYQGANIPSWHIVPQGMDGYDEQLRGLNNAPTSGNPALAASYWQKYLAAHGGKAPVVRLGVTGSPTPTYRDAMAMYQREWSQALGVDVTLQYPPGTIVFENNPNIFQMYRSISVADYPDPQDFLTLLHATGAFFNRESASVPAADTLMRQADALPDMSQRAPLYHQAEQVLVDQTASCPLYQTKNRYLLRNWVRGGFAEDGRGLIPKDAWITGYIATR